MASQCIRKNASADKVTAQQGGGLGDGRGGSRGGSRVGSSGGCGGITKK